MVRKLLRNLAVHVLLFPFTFHSSWDSISYLEWYSHLLDESHFAASWLSFGYSLLLFLGHKHKLIQSLDTSGINLWTKLLTPGLDNTRLFISLTAGAGTRCMSLLSSPPSLCDSWSVQRSHLTAKESMNNSREELFLTTLDPRGTRRNERWVQRCDMLLSSPWRCLTIWQLDRRMTGNQRVTAMAKKSHAGSKG